MSSNHEHLHPDAVRAAREMLAFTALDAEVDGLLAQALPVVHLEPRRSGDPLIRGVSKIGGAGQLPAGMEWPIWDPRSALTRALARPEAAIARPRSKESGLESILLDSLVAMANSLRTEIEAGPRGLSLLATVDLGATPGVSQVGLPEVGVLWFFADPRLFVSERGSWHLQWCAGRELDALRAADIPPNTVLFPATPVNAAPGVFVRADARLTDGRTVRQLERGGGSSGPPLGDFESIAYWKAACVAVSNHMISPFELLGRLNRTLFSGSQALGHKTDEDEWCRPRMFNAYLDSQLRPEERGHKREWEQVVRDAADWQCLLVFDSDEDAFGTGWTWGDVGQLQLWIRRSDLAARRFDNTQLYCNTT